MSSASETTVECEWKDEMWRQESKVTPLGLSRAVFNKAARVM